MGQELAGSFAQSFIMLKSRYCPELLSHLSFFSFFFFKIYLIYFLAVLGLCCCMRAFSSCGKQGLLFAAVPWLFILVASCCRAQVLGPVGFSSCVAYAQLLCGTWELPGPGSNPCPLHWQADS